jgi:flagellar FliL protein
MPTQTTEAPVAAAPPAGDAPSEPAPEKAPASPAGGGIKAWLPLLITVITMPALAYVTTMFVLVPKMQKSLDAAAQQETAPEAGSKPATPEAAPKSRAASAEKGKEAAATGSTQKDKTVKTNSSGKTTVPMTKILVNVAGTMGSRYLLANLTLVGTRKDFAEVIQDNEAQLIDLAAGVLSAKTIADLERPEARTVIRSELLTVFNNALGVNSVQEVYFTDFAIQ